MQWTSGFSWDPWYPKHLRRNRENTGEDVRAGQTAETKARPRLKGRLSCRHSEGSDTSKI